MAPRLLGQGRGGGTHIGAMMSVASPPPHDSYCTGREGSVSRTQRAAASMLRPCDDSFPSDHVITHA
jgi:hypothetical protein